MIAYFYFLKNDHYNNHAKSAKVLLGILTFLPLLLLISYIGIFISFIFEMAALSTSQERGYSPNNALPFFQENMLILVCIILLMVVSSLGLLIYYIVHIMNNPTLKKNNTQQLVWALIILFGGFIGGIVYYFMEIYPLPNQIEK
jgi:flagellar basal body-associated protein FliL